MVDVKVLQFALAVSNIVIKDMTWSLFDEIGKHVQIF